MSCLPGYFSATNATAKRQRGGPYECAPCEPGTFSASSGATACEPCGMGTYAVGFGSSACTACALFNTSASAQTTAIIAAYDPRQCVKCWPGTKKCEECVQGEYQVSAAHSVLWLTLFFGSLCGPLFWNRMRAGR